MFCCFRRRFLKTKAKIVIVQKMVKVRRAISKYYMYRAVSNEYFILIFAEVSVCTKVHQNTKSGRLHAEGKSNQHRNFNTNCSIKRVLLYVVV